MPTKPTAIFLVGPTAIGKTATAIRLAKALNTEIISADSRQFYKEMSIGTAKPTAEEQSQVKHHFIDSIGIESIYSAGAYERDVLEFLNGFFKTRPQIVITGGSGLYLDAIAKGLDDLPSDPEIRNLLNRQFQSEGIEGFQEELRRLDPEFFEQIDRYNPQRVIRALEVCRCSGKPYSAFRQDGHKSRQFTPLWLGITADRHVLYERINQRVDVMVEQGLIEEVERLLPYRQLNALNTVGYKELFAYFDGELTRDEAISKIKQHTRNFAKRQMTWFKKHTDIRWFDYNQTQDLIAYASEQCSASRGL